MKRIVLFLLTNVAVMVVLGIVVNLFGLNRFLTANGLNLTGLLGGPTGLQGIPDFVRLSGCKRIELTDPPVSLRNGLLQLLDRAAMDSFPIAQFNLQLMYTVSGRFQLLHLGAELVSVGEPFVELGDLVS